MHFLLALLLLVVCVTSVGVVNRLDTINNSIQQCNKQAPAKVFPPTDKRIM